jgi:formiminoglutamase
MTRTLGKPTNGVHAVQMELACRGYMPEKPGPVSEADWPLAYDASYAAPMRATLTHFLKACIAFAE